MRVLMASMELEPVLKVGGVGEAVAQWCRALGELGHQVTAVLPVAAPDAPRAPAELDVRILGIDGCSSENPYVLAFDEAGPRVDRLARLADGVIDLCARAAAAGAPFDVLHVNDWPLAVVPYLLRHRRFGFTPPRTVLTIHSAVDLGLFPPHLVTDFGLAPQHASPIYQDGTISLLRAGLLTADAVTAPSPTYAQEICTPGALPEPAGELCAMARERPGSVRGILHGLDASQWDPATEPCLAARFDAGDLGPREVCKAALYRAVELSTEGAGPLLVSCGRLCPEKGTDALIEALPSLVGLGARVLVAGAGQPRYVEAMRKAVAAQPQGRARFLGWAGPDLLRQLLAAADLLLIPSVCESGGLTHLQAHRFGAVPVARKTGGLADTIVAHVEGSADSNGFLYEGQGAPALVRAVEGALAVMHTPAFLGLQRRGMRRPRSWLDAAREYEQVYLGRPETGVRGSP